MRFASESTDGLQIFAVAGTHTVSFGISADATAREGLLGFAVQRFRPTSKSAPYLRGYKVFRSLIPNPDATTDVSTYRHPIQSLVWDDFTAAPGREYDYKFHPMKGDPAKPDRLPAVTIRVQTEPLTGGAHDVFFNRGVTASQYYAKRFENKSPDQQPTEQDTKAALNWLGNGLDDALIRFIRSAKSRDSLRGCFYEFSYGPVLDEFVAAAGRGVDVQLVVDEKPNTDSFPLTENLAAITAANFPTGVILPRVARKDAIAHNKFVVLIHDAAPSEVWTGSTNLTTGGIYGQANVGHLVRDPALAQRYLDYWQLLSADPGAPTAAKSQPANQAFLGEVAALTPVPALADIPVGVTPLFSPRDGLAPLDLYVDLLAHAERLTCATFAFGIPNQFKTVLENNTAAGPLCFLLLESRDRPNTSSHTPFIRLNATNNVYEASGSELQTAIGQWVVETDSRQTGLNVHVAFIHLKILLHDPLGTDPIIVTGSANFSAASTDTNDENMIIIRGDRRVADIYFTEFNRLWAHFQFRSVVEATTASGSADPSRWQFLKEDDSWLTDYEPGDLRSKRVDQYVTMAI